MPAAAEHFAVQKPGVPRTTLPFKHVPPRTIDASKTPAIKFQEIVRDGQATIVERVKIPPPCGYTFILCRLDTGTISVTTMFRAAFPTGMKKPRRVGPFGSSLLSTPPANKSSKARFADAWITLDIALYLTDSSTPSSPLSLLLYLILQT